MRCLTFSGAAHVLVAREKCQQRTNQGKRSYHMHTCTRVPIHNIVAPSFESLHPPIFVAWRSDIDDFDGSFPQKLGCKGDVSSQTC